jgi:hypothetical protein
MLEIIFQKFFQYCHYIALNIFSDSKSDPFENIFSYGNTKKNSYGDKLGEYGGYSNTGICLLVKNCYTKSEKANYHEAISTCVAKDLVILGKCAAVNIPKL